MAYDWSDQPITSGSTIITAAYANTARNRAYYLITALTANTGNCSGYSCSSLTSNIPAEVSVSSTAYGTWLSGMQDKLDQIDTAKYCTVAKNSNLSQVYGSDRNNIKSGYRSGIESSTERTIYYGECHYNKNTCCNALKDPKNG